MQRMYAMFFAAIVTALLVSSCSAPALRYVSDGASKIDPAKKFCLMKDGNLTGGSLPTDPDLTDALVLELQVSGIQVVMNKDSADYLIAFNYTPDRSGPAGDGLLGLLVNSQFKNVSTFDANIYDLKGEGNKVLAVADQSCCKSIKDVARELSYHIQGKLQNKL
jgi:hypothetical protein